MKRIIAIFALSLTVGCLPRPAAPISDDGKVDSGREDTGGPDPQDAGQDMARDVGGGDSECPSGDEAIATWCVDNAFCGPIVPIEGCPEIDCGNPCNEAEACVDSVCRCDPDAIEGLCTEADVTCGELPIRCEGESVMCDQCTDFQVCDGENTCVSPTLDPPDRFANEENLQFGWHMNMHEGLLLIASSPVETDAYPNVFVADTTMDDLSIQVLDKGFEDSGLSSVSAFGASFAARDGYAIIGSPMEGPHGTGSRFRGIARTFELKRDQWVPYDVGVTNAIFDEIEDPSNTSFFSETVAVDHPYFAVGARRHLVDDKPRGRVDLWQVVDNQLQYLGPDYLFPTDEPERFEASEYGAALEMGDRMLFIGAPGARKTQQPQTQCGIVRVYELPEVGSGDATQVFDIEPPECMTGVRPNNDQMFDADFGRALHYDGEFLFVGATRYPQGTGWGRVLIYRVHDERPLVDRFELVSEVDIPVRREHIYNDLRWSMTRAGDALAIGIESSGVLRDGTGIVVLLRPEDGVWKYWKSWEPEAGTTENRYVGSSVAGTPDGTLYVGARLTSSMGLRQRGVVYVLDLNNE